jgi:hypothetical protein
LAGNASKHLVDNACVSDDQDPLSLVRPGDTSDGPQHAFTKSTVALSARPGKIFICLRFVPLPELRISLSNIVHRHPVEEAAIDFGKRLQHAHRAKKAGRRRFRSIKSSSKRTAV